MSVREYIGARYVPIFADPIDWDSTKTYEPLTIVYYQGNSYTSRQAVPAGISIENSSYWVLTGNYNAQIEQYRAEVQTFDGRIDALEDALPVADFSQSTVSDELTALDTKIDNVNTSLDGRIDDIEDALPISAFNSQNTVDARFDDIEANNWVTTNRIANGNVTTDKLANSSVTNSKISDGTITKSKLSKKKMIIFGDSWGTGDNNTWPANLSNQLNLTLVNYSAGGVGWYYGTNNIQTQINNATADNEAEIVIAIGGINDVRNSVSYDNYKNAITSCANNIATKYPNARCFIIPINVPAKALGQFTKNAINNFYWNVFTDVALRSKPISIIDIIGWLQPLAPFNVYTGDNLHMSSYGQMMFGNFLYSTINGAYLRSTKVQYPANAATGITIYGGGLKINEGLVHCDIEGITIPATQAGSTINIGNFGFNANTTPWYNRPSVDTIYIPCISMSDGAYVGKLLIEPSGAITFTAAIGVGGNIAPICYCWGVV